MRAVALVALTILLSGCLNDFGDDRTNHLSIHALDVAAPVVRSGTADLVVSVTLDNAGGRSGDVDVQVKAIRTDTGLLAHTARLDVGPMAKDQTRIVDVPFMLPRDTGYRFEVSVFQDQQVHVVRSITIGSLAGLLPNLVPTGLQVAGIDFLVDSVGESVAIEADIYLTNEAATDSPPVRMQVKAREISTGLLSDVQWLDIGPAPPEETHRHAVGLSVPADYNYEVEVVLWIDDFIVGRGSGHVQLLPTLVVPDDSDIVVQRPDLDDFARGRAASGHAEAGESTPGLGIVTIALLALALAHWRRT